MSALIAAEGSRESATVRVCETMARHWRRVANISVGSARGLG